MHEFTFFLFAGLVIFAAVNCAPPEPERELPLIPIPRKVDPGEETFRLTPATHIFLQAEEKAARETADYLAELIESRTGFNLPIETGELPRKPEDAIILTTKDISETLGPEGYFLIVRPAYVLIRAHAPAGLFYAIQTLRQLLPPEFETGEFTSRPAWEIPRVRIKDRPRFRWRGAHLDVCRHFFPKEFIKKYIDILAYHKMNTFHWHLTEDQGWRIEIKKYPKLTEIGAWRVDREHQPWQERTPPQPGEKATYGGFYTQDEVREIVEYARRRFITVIPEIEMPAHAVAALTAYPELSCTGGPFYVMPGSYWPITDIFCAGNDSTFTFLEDVLREVMALFPSEFIHIGGDEAFKDNWRKCPKCQARIRTEGLKDEDELQSYFVKRIERFVNSHGRRIIGWDEILEGGLAPNAAVMSWRGMDGGIAAATAGHDVIMTPTSHCYFDYYQGKFGEPEAIGGFLPLEKVYAFEPVPGELPRRKRRHILGAQANVWTEYIPTPEHAEYMLLPRLAALAEVVWSPKDRRDLQRFRRRLLTHYDRLAAQGLNFRVPPPLDFGGRRIIFEPTEVTLQSPLPESEILYTRDGSIPGAGSPRATAPLLVQATTSITARTCMRNGRMSVPVTTDFFLVDPDTNGVQVDYYEGVWDSLPDFSQLTPLRSEEAYDISLDAVEHAGSDFALRFRTLLQIREAGEYTFFLNSDDGARLFLDDTLVVNNDGLHGPQEASGAIMLSSGLHKLELHYFQRGGGQALALAWQGPGMDRQSVPADRFFTISY